MSAAWGEQLDAISPGNATRAAPNQKLRCHLSEPILIPGVEFDS
jgi:hypothetical protein